MAYQQGGYGAPSAPGQVEYCLKYPGELQPVASLDLPNAVNLLKRGMQVAATQPFHWSYIDRPDEGYMCLLFLVPQAPGVPPDGIRYLEKDMKYTIAGGPDLDLEVIEAKHGYIPSVDQAAHRTRRVYRLIRGGHQHLCLVHYSRGQAFPIPQQLMNVPVRQYPLRPLNDPPVVPLAHGGPTPVPPGANSVAMQQQRSAPARSAALVQAQSAELEAREKQRLQMTNTQIRQPEPDYDSGDEGTAHITPRNLALMRFKRNHALMNEVFNHAAKLETPPSIAFSPSGGFNAADIDAVAAKLEQEIEALQKRAAARRRIKEEVMLVDETVA